MTSDENRIYEFEVRGAWSGALIDEISDISESRGYEITRNGVETLDFSIDLDKLEERMTEIGEDAYAVLEPYATDIIVKKNGVPLFGVHVYDRTYTLSSDKRKVGIKADGFLNLFKDRYITKEYEDESMTAIAWDLIDTTQDETNGDFGVTLGGDQYTTALRDRTYEDKNIKDAIIQQTDILGSEFDFKFTWDKEFKTYENIGNDRPDIILSYPEDITEVSIPDSAASLANRVRAIGSGVGDNIVSISNNLTSQVNYKLREKVMLYNDVSVQNTLDENSARDLSLVDAVLNIPKITLPGSALDLTDVWIGDRVKVIIKGIPSLPINGMYRIEKIKVALDDNDQETITLDLDNYGL